MQQPQVRGSGRQERNRRTPQSEGLCLDERICEYAGTDERAGTECGERSRSHDRSVSSGTPSDGLGRLREDVPMSALKDQLQGDLTEAMRSQDELTMATIRMALAAITTAEVSGKEARELSDDEVIVVLSSEAKKRREAAESFDAAGAKERADRERAELGVLQRYLPEQLTEDEIRAIVADAVAAAAAEGKSGPSAMGVVMKSVTPQTRGRADGGQVAAMVKAALGT